MNPAAAGARGKVGRDVDVEARSASSMSESESFVEGGGRMEVISGERRSVARVVPGRDWEMEGREARRWGKGIERDGRGVNGDGGVGLGGEGGIDRRRER